MTPPTTPRADLIAACPFCGSTVSLTPGTKSDRVVAFTCDDPTSPCRGSGLLQCCLEDHVETALAAWNTRAALATEGETAGWVLVPKEPTDAMLKAATTFAMKVSLSGDYRWSDYMRDLWHVMSSASPRAEEVKP